MFLALWTLRTVGVQATIDLIINYDVLKPSARSRRDCEIDLQKLIGLSTDLSDVRRGGHDRWSWWG